LDVLNEVIMRVFEHKKVKVQCRTLGYIMSFSVPFTWKCWDM